MPTKVSEFDASRFDWCAQQIREELQYAYDTWPNFNSLHEGWAIIKEELDELWSEVRYAQKHPNDEPTIDAVVLEAIQVAAMAIRLIMDCCIPHVDRAILAASKATAPDPFEEV